jgi:hypothetical protein
MLPTSPKKSCSLWTRGADVSSFITARTWRQMARIQQSALHNQILKPTTMKKHAYIQAGKSLAIQFFSMYLLQRISDIHFQK